MRSPEGNFIFYRIIYFATSWNFGYMVSELEKYVEKIQIYEKSWGFRGPFIRTVFYYLFSCGNGRIRLSHVEIELGKNSKAKHTNAH